MGKYILMVAMLVSTVFLGANSVNAVTSGNLYKSVVLVERHIQDTHGNLFLSGTGSGIVMNSYGLVLTNYHVIVDDIDNPNQFNTVLGVCIQYVPTDNVTCDYRAEVVAFDKNLDLALLQLHPVDLLGASINFTPVGLAPDLPETGSKVRTVGYPGIGGRAASVSEGTVSGINERYDKKWIKTDALVSSGSSGGALVNERGELIGVPTLRYSDLSSSLGYALSIDSIRAWFKANEKQPPQRNQLTKKLSELYLKSSKANEYEYLEFGDRGFVITREADFVFEHYNENEFRIIPKSGSESVDAHISVKFTQTPRKYSAADIISSDRLIDYLSTGTPAEYSSSTHQLGKLVATKIVRNYQGEISTALYYATSNELMQVKYSYGLNNKYKNEIDKMLSSILYKGRGKTVRIVDKYENFDPMFSVAFNSDWLVEHSYTPTTPIVAIHEINPKARFEINIAKLTEFERSSSLDVDLANELSTIEQSKDSLAHTGTTIKGGVEITSKNGIQGLLKTVSASRGNKQIIAFKSYTFKNSTYKINITHAYDGNDENFDRSVASFDQIVSSFSWSNVPNKFDSIENKKFEVSAGNDAVKEVIHPVVSNHDDKLFDRLVGQILLSVEERGEAWYLDHKSRMRYYLKDGNVAYEALRKFGLGITNKDLNKIPIGIDGRLGGEDTDQDGLSNKLENAIGTNMDLKDSDKDGSDDYSEVLEGTDPLSTKKSVFDQSVVKKNLGKILLQVESRGQAWYVNPKDGKRYYMADGENAYKLMRYKSTGIKKQDLDKIKDGQL